MSKSLLSLVLIFLQGLFALPGRVELCFEASGAFCCIERGGEACHGSDCAHSHESACGDECCGHDNDLPACDLSSKPPQDDALLARDNRHQHVSIDAPASESTRVERLNHRIASASPAHFAALPIFAAQRFQHTTPLSHLAFPPEAFSFSLLARASSVLRC